MKLMSMLKHKSGWLSNTGPMSDIVISSRIRIARNLNKIPFPHRANTQQQEESFMLIEEASRESSYLKKAVILNFKDYDRVDRQFLMERHLISYEHANGDGVRGVVVGDKELISIMINEEDHLRLQGMQSGLQLKEVWDVVEEIDNDIESRLVFAFSDEMGYLTACPTNTGTGLRASILVHLPALVLRNEIDRLLQMLGKLGIVTRGLYGENTKVMGDMFQISNQVTLGPVEETIISKLESVGKRVVDSELKSRNALYKEDKTEFEDKVYRAYGLLRNVRRISFQETMDLISKIKLGIYLGLAIETSIDILNELMIITQPSHLQEEFGERLQSNQRDVMRADLIRKHIGDVVR